ncbi:MAG: hypothetical protein ABR536_03085 [Solirubrobacterales bacterium]
MVRDDVALRVVASLAGEDFLALGFFLAAGFFAAEVLFAEAALLVAAPGFLATGFLAARFLAAGFFAALDDRELEDREGREGLIRAAYELPSNVDDKLVPKHRYARNLIPR